VTAKLPITLVVVARDEERNLPRCLDAAGFCAETLVVDSGSTDRTVEIARERGARVLERAWTGYRDQKNFGAAQAAQPWILCLDADEVVTPALRDSILAAFRDGDPAADAFELNRHGVYAGRLIDHSGWYPEWRTFLYRKGSAVWSGREPHPYVEFRGRVRARLDGDLLHHTYADLAEHLRKNAASARAAAAAMHEDGRRARWTDLLVRPKFALLRRLVLQRAYLDGYRGLCIAVMAGVYTFLKYAHLRELQDRHQPTSTDTDEDIILDN
jgi:glycosyltransferase involved in cell wall biosynthesis